MLSDLRLLELKPTIEDINFILHIVIRPVLFDQYGPANDLYGYFRGKADLKRSKSFPFKKHLFHHKPGSVHHYLY